MAKTVSKRTGNSANLKPFQKGQSGNPSGRPKQNKDVAEVARENAEKAIRRLAKLVDSDDDRVALAAAQAVLDRAVGKPVQSINSTVENKRDIRDLSGRELDERIDAALRRIESIATGAPKAQASQHGSARLRKLDRDTRSAGTA